MRRSFARHRRKQETPQCSMATRARPAASGTPLAQRPSYVAFALTRLVRQRELERCAPGRIRPGPQPAPMRLDDCTTDRETHSGPIGLRREKGIEDPVHVLTRKADARVGH